MKSYMAILGMLTLTLTWAVAMQSCTPQESSPSSGETADEPAAQAETYTGQAEPPAAQAEQADTLAAQGERPETLMLVPMMQLLLSDLQTLDEGIYLEDYGLMAEGAGGIADHPTMTEGEKALIKSALGEDMSRFVAFDMTVHHQADSIRTAAQNQQLGEVLRHYRIMQQGCVDCHSNFRTPIQEARQENRP